MLEKYRLIKNKSRNVPDEKPEESSTEVDFVDDQASHGAAKDICGETVLELIQDQPITKFEEDDFAKSQRRPRLPGRKLSSLLFLLLSVLIRLLILFKPSLQSA